MCIHVPWDIRVASHFNPVHIFEFSKHLQGSLVDVKKLCVRNPFIIEGFQNILCILFINCLMTKVRKMLYQRKYYFYI